MSSIVFEGNTYTFGATISANPGTGTTSYVFGGLSSGWTYGFIIWAFNGLGPSSTVGPITKVTLSEIPEEERPLIGAGAWVWAHEPLESYEIYFSEDPVNILPATADFNDTRIWTPVYTSISTGHTAPDGSTTGWAFYKSSGTPRYNTRFYPTLPDAGGTYIFSAYIDVSRGVSTGLRFHISRDTSSRWPLGNPVGFTMAQILPVTGPFQYSTIRDISFPAGVTGWQRVAVEILVPVTPDAVNISPFSHNSSAGSTLYIWGVQLEKVS
jgi:hypothetical protein